jgi:hypothetical protein
VKDGDAAEDDDATMTDVGDDDAKHFGYCFTSIDTKAY